MSQGMSLKNFTNCKHLVRVNTVTPGTQQSLEADSLLSRMTTRIRCQLSSGRNSVSQILQHSSCALH